MNLIILGDKFQKRMKSKGCVGLLKTNNKPIIQHQYEIIKQSFPNISSIIYIYGFEGKKFASFLEKNPTLSSEIITIYNKHYDFYNNVYSLSLAEKYLSTDFIVMFGDNILHKKSFANFKTSSGSQIFIDPKQNNKLGCIIHKNKIENIAYDLDNYLSEIYYISKDHASVTRDLLKDSSLYNCFIFEIVNKLIDMNHQIKPFINLHHSKPLTTIK